MRNKQAVHRPDFTGGTAAFQQFSRIFPNERKPREIRIRSAVSVQESCFTGESESARNSLDNHFRARRQSRCTVSAETFSTWAVSSIDNPPKYFNSTTFALRPSKVASFANASSRATTSDLG